MKILLVNPPYVGWLNDVKVEPIGLLYIASYLRNWGHEIALYDPYIGETEAAFIEKIENWKPEIVACAVYTVSEDFCIKLARVAKRIDPGVLFVAGGPHATFAATRMFKRSVDIDIVTHKESEESMLEIVNALSAGTDFGGIAGISWRPRLSSSLEQPIISNQERLSNLPIEEFPFPARDLLSEKYYERYRAAGVISARGCAYKCDFCVSPVFFKGVRQRKIEDVVKEIREVMVARKCRHIHFYDDVFALGLKRMQHVRDLIGPLGITWDCYVRIDCLTKDMLSAMKEAGCVQVRFGVESGIEERRALRKGGRTVSFDAHLNIVEICRTLGIESLASYIIGFPDETRDDILGTIEFADRLNTDKVGFYKLTPYPGTIYWKQLVNSEIHYDTYTKLENDVSLNANMNSQELLDLVRLAYETYYRNRRIPYDSPDTLRFLTSLPKLAY